MLTSEDFVAHVAMHSGAPTQTAERATLAVLAGLGGHLTPAEREIIASELPAKLGVAVLEAADLAMPLLNHVLVPGMSVGHARELIASVGRVLVEELSRDAVEILREHVPSISRYLAPPADEVTFTPARPGSLATGRPGSQHPISESPRSDAHTDSIAAQNPHGATKLSSSPGTTQERRHETLAEGHPARR